MNTDRLIRMGMNMLMRYGMRWFAKRQKPTPNDPQAKNAAKQVRMVNRIRRM